MSAHLGQLRHLVELKTLSRPEIVVNQDQGSRFVPIVTASDSDSNTFSSSRIAAVSPRSQSSSATSDDEAYDQLNHSQDSDDDRSSDKMLIPLVANIAVDIVPVSRMAGFVLFGVSTSKRLQSARLRLAQIDVEVLNDDDSLFDELINQYKKL